MSEARLSEVGSQQEDLSEIGLSQVGLSEIGLVQTRLAQIGTAQVGPHEVGVPQVGSTQIGVDLRILSSPRIPRRDSLLENSEVLLICHRVFLLFGCCSHSMALGEHLQGHRAHSLTKTVWWWQFGSGPALISTAPTQQGLLAVSTCASLSYTIASSFVSSNERVEPFFSIPGQSLMRHRLVGSMRGQLVTRRSAKQ